MYKKGYPGTWESSCCSICEETATGEKRYTRETRPGAVIGSAEEREISVEQRRQSAGGTGSEGNEVNGTAR